MFYENLWSGKLTFKNIFNIMFQKHIGNTIKFLKMFVKQSIKN